MLLSGEAGGGKTALLDVGAAYAVGAGTRVLRATGAEFEANVSFAGLNQLLHPLFADMDRLSPAHATALRVSLGLADGRAFGEDAAHRAGGAASVAALLRSVGKVVAGSCE